MHSKMNQRLGGNIFTVGEEIWFLSNESRDVEVSRGRAESFSEVVASDLGNVLSILWWTMYSPLSTEDGEL